MAEEIILKAKVMHKHETEEDWEKSNYVPRESELVVYDEDNNHNYKRFKIGDGDKKVKDLPFSTGLALEDGEGKESIQSPSSIAKGIYSIALGCETKAESQTSISLGRANIAAGNGSFATGYQTLAEGDMSHTEGHFTITRGGSSHAEGYGTKASGVGSHSEGVGRTIKLTISSDDTINNQYKYKAATLNFYPGVGQEFFYQNNLYKITSVTRTDELNGIFTTDLPISTDNINNVAIYVLTEPTEASGKGSHAEGYGTVATADYQHVQGRYNIEDTNEDFAHIVGNGDSTRRSNAHTLDWDGNAWFAGKVTVGGSSQDESKELATQEDVSNKFNELNFENGEEEGAVQIKEFAEAKGIGAAAFGGRRYDYGPYKYSWNIAVTLDGTYTTYYGYYYKNDKEEYATLSSADTTNIADIQLVHDGTITAIGGSVYTVSITSATIGENVIAPIITFTKQDGTRVNSTIEYNEYLGRVKTIAYGNQSFAAGGSTLANGDWSAAFGQDSKAYQRASFAEGGSAIAGDPEGDQGAYSFAHAEGEANKAIGRGSHAEGSNNQTLAMASHVEGTLNKVEKNADSGHAEGRQNTLNGKTSHVEGYLNKMNGENAHVEGRNNTVDITAKNGHTEGYYNVISAENAHAEGSGNKILKNANSSHVEGISNTIASDASAAHAEGESTYTSGQHAHAEGYGTRAIGESSHAEGRLEKKSLIVDEVTYQLETTGAASHTEGINNAVYSQGGHAEGFQNIITEDSKYSHAEGVNNVLKGAFSHAEGNNNRVLGQSGHAEGYKNTVSGEDGHAEGSMNTASGSYTHVEGYRNTASHTGAHVIGQFNESSAGYQFVAGSCCAKDSGAVVIIGNGSSTINEDGTYKVEGKNAFVVKKNGRAVLGADPIYAMDAVTKQYLDNKIGKIETVLDAIIAKQNELIGGETA